MAWSISDLFPPWGDSGERPPDNFQYDGGDQVNEKHIDYLWSSIGSLEDEVRSALDDIDSDSDGIVDEADTANLYKGNDIDSDGDGTVDQADGAGSVSDSGTVIVSYPTDINFDSPLTVTDDGDGTVTISANTQDTRTDVSDDGTTIVSDTDDINFSANLTVTDDGDGTVTIDATDTNTDTRTDVSEGGTTVVSDTDDINFTGIAASVSDDGDGSVTVSTGHNHDNRYVLESGDTMSGDLTMNGNNIYWQPDSAGGVVTAMTFESNENAGSDFAYIEYHDDYFGGGEQSALVLRAENDSDSSAGPDSVVLDGIGGTYVERGGLNIRQQGSPAGLTIGGFDNDHIELQSSASGYGWQIDTVDNGSGYVPLRIVDKSGGSYTKRAEFRSNGDINIEGELTETAAL